MTLMCFSRQALIVGLVALTLSTWFEEYHWTPGAVLGTILVLAGNLIVLIPRRAPPVAVASAPGGGQ